MTSEQKTLQRNGVAHDSSAGYLEIADWKKLPKQPLVSVWMITYQHENYIREALDGVLMQQVDFEYEICLGEDGSTDGTREICTEYAGRYPERVRLFLRDRDNPKRSEYRVPFMHNMVETLRACRGKYVAMCEGDDYWTNPRKLQKQVDCLERDTATAACAHQVAHHFSSETDREQFGGQAAPGRYSDRDIARGIHGHTSSIMFRNYDIARAIDGSLLKTVPMADRPLQLFACREGHMVILPEKMSVYRLHPGGSWSQGSLSERVQIEFEATRCLLQTSLFSAEVINCCCERLIILLVRCLKLYGTEWEKFIGGLLDEYQDLVPGVRLLAELYGRQLEHESATRRMFESSWSWRLGYHLLRPIRIITYMLRGRGAP